MKNISKSIIVALFIAFAAQAQVKNNLEYYRYELECVGTGVDGTYLIKVWNYSKRSKVAIKEAKRNAVHGVIFKGFGAGENCQSQKPLASSPGIEEQSKDYFTDFFSDNGKYQKFINVSGDGSIASEDILKVGKEYKIGIVVSVMKDALRAELEQAGVIKGLSSGF
ncbi:MAG: hypothetical protein SFY32_13165 [Bacteroidota bacterium]|nr:hypothetical protein [Bacteroidota bacterium]